MQRFFLSPDHIQGGEVFFPAEVAHQMARVLRLRAGARVWVLDGSGAAHEVELHTLERRAAQGRIVATHPLATEPHVELILYPALLKGKKLDWVLQKGTELGVARFAPILTRRTVSLKEVGDTKTERWESIVREAAEQSGRARLPEVVEPQSLEAALALAVGGPLLLPWEAGKGRRTLREVLRAEGDGDPTTVHLFVGPEGGWEVEEVALAQSFGAVPVTLGPRILRAETAAVAAVAAVMYELGEWGGGTALSDIDLP